MPITPLREEQTHLESNMLLLCLEVFSRNVNVPWPYGGFEDSEYLYVFQKLLLPIAHEFDPEFVIGKFLVLSELTNLK